MKLVTKLPVVVGFTINSIYAVSQTFNVPIVQTPVAVLYVPFVLTIVKSLSNSFLRTTAVALSGPRLVTLIIYFTDSLTVAVLEEGVTTVTKSTNTSEVVFLST